MASIVRQAGQRFKQQESRGTTPVIEPTQQRAFSLSGRGHLFYAIWLMPPPRGTRVIPFIISDHEAVLVYSATGQVWLQLRRTVPTEQDIAAPSFKVAVTLTPEQAIAIAGELLTAATHHRSPLPRSPLAERPVLPPTVPSASMTNLGKPWTPAEERKLLDAFDAGTPIAQIAEALGRGTGGVRSRLVKLGRIAREPGRPYPPDNPDEPLGDEGTESED